MNIVWFLFVLDFFCKIGFFPVGLFDVDKKVNKENAFCCQELHREMTNWNLREKIEPPDTLMMIKDTGG